MDFEEIKELISSLGQPKYRAEQLYSGLQAGKSLENINIPKDFVQNL